MAITVVMSKAGRESSQSAARHPNFWKMGVSRRRDHVRCVAASALNIRSHTPCLRFSPDMMLPQARPEAAARLISFVNASPTPFHAVRSAALRLEKAGFRKVSAYMFSSRQNQDTPTRLAIRSRRPMNGRKT